MNRCEKKLSDETHSNEFYEKNHLKSIKVISCYNKELSVSNETH